MFDQINGLPAHVLLLHAVVVLLPIAALMLVAGAVWPAARARLGVATPVLALITLVLVPVTTHAGQWLQNRLDPSRQNPAITRHAQLGRNLLPWVLGLFVLSVAVYVLERRASVVRSRPGWLTIALAVLCVVVAIGAVYQLYRIGDSGAHAAWDYVHKLPAGR